MAIKKTVLQGPRGAKLHLDPDEVCPGDPGNGTPALVEYPPGRFGTYWCVVETGECDFERIPRKIIDWLESDGVVAAVAGIERLYE